MAQVAGYILWWDLQDVSIDRKPFLELIRKYDLAIKCPKRGSARKAFTAAVNRFEAACKERGLNYKIAFRECKDNGVLYYSVLKQVKTSRTVDYRHVTTIKYRHGNDDPVYYTYKAHEAAQVFRDEYKKRRNSVYWGEIQRMILRYLYVQGNALMLHPMGRIYFILEEYKHVLEGATKLLSDPAMKGKRYFWALPQLDTPALRRIIFNYINEYLDVKMIEINRTSNTYDHHRGGFYKTRHLINLRNVKEKIDLYVKRFEFDLRGRDLPLIERVKEFSNG